MSVKDDNDEIFHSTFESTEERASSLHDENESLQFLTSYDSSNATLSVKSNTLSSISTAESVDDDYTQDDFESIEETDPSTTSADHTMSKDSLSMCDDLSSTEIKLREDFMRRKINLLQNQSKKQHAPLPSELTSFHCVEGPAQEYNKMKVKLLQSKDFNKKGVTGQRVVKSLITSSKATWNQNHLKNTRKLEMLKIENAMFDVEKKLAASFHQPRKCKDCRKIKSQLTENEYVKKKVSQLQKQQFYEDLEKHLYQKDSATLIADIINSGPKPSDPPKEIWDRLLHKEKYS